MSRVLDLWASMTGTVLPFAGAAAPGGWLLCHGQAVSRSEYANLFGVIGETFGDGDGSTTFNVPDLRGEFIRGLDAGRGVDAGRTLGSAQDDAFQGHWHAISSLDPPQVEHNYPYRFSTTPGTGTGGIAATNQTEGVNKYTSEYAEDTDRELGVPRVAEETRPRNIAMTHIIKI